MQEITLLNHFLTTADVVDELLLNFAVHCSHLESDTGSLVLHELCCLTKDDSLHIFKLRLVGLFYLLQALIELSFKSLHIHFAHVAGKA